MNDRPFRRPADGVLAGGPSGVVTPVELRDAVRAVAAQAPAGSASARELCFRLMRAALRKNGFGIAVAEIDALTDPAVYDKQATRAAESVARAYSGTPDAPADPAPEIEGGGSEL